MKKKSSLKVVDIGPGCPGKVESSSLEVSKKRADVALKDTVSMHDGD